MKIIYILSALVLLGGAVSVIIRKESDRGLGIAITLLASGLTFAIGSIIQAVLARR